MIFEIVRESARYLAEFDPFVLLTVRRSCITLAKAAETAVRLNKLGASKVTTSWRVGTVP